MSFDLFIEMRATSFFSVEECREIAEKLGVLVVFPEGFDFWNQAGYLPILAAVQEAKVLTSDGFSEAGFEMYWDQLSAETEARSLTFQISAGDPLLSLIVALCIADYCVERFQATFEDPQDDKIYNLANVSKLQERIVSLVASL